MANVIASFPAKNLVLYIDNPTYGASNLFYERLFKWIFLISFSLMLIFAYYKDNLPDPQTYDFISLDPPIQSETSREPFTITTNKQRYEITPKFEYELTGVVVTYSNADGFTNIWHHDVWKDFINVRDLCVIWGPNVSSGVYKKVNFSSDSWTCWYAWKDSSTTDNFKFTAVSNNHLLTDNNQIKATLLSAEIGDIIHFKGVLASYKNEDSGAERSTSIKRTDTGNGACETVYIDEFNVIKKANPVLRNFYKLTKWIAIFSLIGFLIMFVRTPFKSR